MKETVLIIFELIKLNKFKCFFFQLINSAIKKKKNVEMKSSPKDLVTETDKAVEDLLISNLKKHFNDHK